MSDGAKTEDVLDLGSQVEDQLQKPFGFEKEMEN
jgi:UDP-N-acetylenolpyruvoylglucosamine reductase